MALLLMSSSLGYVLQSSETAQGIRPESFDTSQIKWTWLEFDKSHNYMWIDFDYYPKTGDESYMTIVPVIVYDVGNNNELVIMKFNLDIEKNRVKFMVNNPSNMQGHIERIDIFAEDEKGHRILVHSMNDILLEQASEEFNGAR